MAYKSIADLYDEELDLVMKESRGLRRKKKKKLKKPKMPKAVKASKLSIVKAAASSALARYRESQRQLREDMAKEGY